MQIFHAWENADADLKNSFYLLIFQLKIKQSAQSHLTSCEIKRDLEGYSVGVEGNLKSFRKDGNTMFY